MINIILTNKISLIYLTINISQDKSSKIVIDRLSELKKLSS